MTVTGYPKKIKLNTATVYDFLTFCRQHVDMIFNFKRKVKI